MKLEFLWWLHEENRALRVGDWKFVAAKGDPWKLYDLSKDRGESKNLASEQSDRVREMEALWNTQTEEIRTLASQDLLTGDAQPGAKKRKRGSENN